MIDGSALVPQDATNHERTLSLDLPHSYRGCCVCLSCLVWSCTKDALSIVSLLREVSMAALFRLDPQSFDTRFAEKGRLVFRYCAVRRKRACLPTGARKRLPMLHRVMRRIFRGILCRRFHMCVIHRVLVFFFFFFLVIGCGCPLFLASAALLLSSHQPQLCDNCAIRPTTKDASSAGTQSLTRAFESRV